MNKVLIKCRNIHIGDILFASSVAKKIKQENISCDVHYDIDYLQPIELLGNNPYIDRVFFKDNEGEYDFIYNLIENTDVIDPYESATSQFQKKCNIKNFDDTFEIFSSPALDYSIKQSMSELVSIGEWNSDVIKIGYQMDWNKKSFLFSEKEYVRAEGAESGKGYGGKHRNVFDIIECMETDPNIILFALGLDEKLSKKYPTLNSTSKFTFTTSLIKNCDYVIGAEGCLTNISSALGIPTIITTDYIFQMFGPRGIRWKQSGGDEGKLETRTPFLGPCKYFPHGKHIHLNPFLTDKQVGDQILEIVQNGN